MRRTWQSVMIVGTLAAACGGGAKPTATPSSAKPAEPPPATAAPLAAVVEAPLPTIPDAPQAAPADLIAEASIASLPQLTVALSGYVDAVRPGMGALISLPTITAQSGMDFSGVDLTRPIRAFALDPSTHGEPVVVVVAIADQAALARQVEALGMRMVEHGGWAAIGPIEALRDLAPYALTTGVATTPPARPTVTFATAALMARHQADIDESIADVAAASPNSQRDLIASSLRSYVDVLAQLSQVELSLDVSATHATLELAAVPKPGSGVAAFVAAQRPGTFGLLEKLGGGDILAGGRVDTSTMFTAMVEMSRPFIAMTYGPANADKIATAFAKWPALLNGEQAMTVAVTPGAFAMAGLWDTTRGAEVQAMLLDFLKLASDTRGGMIEAKVDTKRAPYRNVRFAIFTARPAADAPADVQVGYQMFGGTMEAGYAVAGKSMLMAMGADPVAQLKRLTDLALPKKALPKPSAALAATLATARQRGDSYLIAVDVPALVTRMQGGTEAATSATELSTMSIATQGGRLLFRTTLPASQTAGLIP
ncbi:MAG: hypothetical protein R3B06_24120 [Kofleriaceae bacterium]